MARAPNAGPECQVPYAERDVGKEDGQWRRRGVGGWVGAFECHQPLRRKRNQGEGGGRGLLRCRHLHREPQHNHATLCAHKQGKTWKGAMRQALLGGGGLRSGCRLPAVMLSCVKKMAKGPPRCAAVRPSQARPQRCYHWAVPWTTDAGWVHPGGALASMPLERPAHVGRQPVPK